MRSRWKSWRLDAIRGLYYLRHALRRRISYNAGLGVEAYDEFYAEIWRAAAEEIEATFVMLSDSFFEVRLNGRMTRIWRNNVMMDNPVLLQMARDKVFASKLLADSGLPVPRQCEFRLQTLEKALVFLSREAGSCVVKPARGTGGGVGVTTNVRTVRDLKRAALHASLFSSRLLVEQQIEGDSYRLLYLNGELLDAVRRRASKLVGDGRSTIRQLIAAENRRRALGRGFAAQSLVALDLDCRNTLRGAGLSLRSIPAVGTEVVVKTVSNDNSNEESESVRSFVGESLVRTGAQAANVLGIRLAGVDVITPDCSRPLEECGGVITEVNVSPGLHFHYQVRNPERIVPVAVPILSHLLDVSKETCRAAKKEHSA